MWLEIADFLLILSDNSTLPQYKPKWKIGFMKYYRHFFVRITQKCRFKYFLWEFEFFDNLIEIFLDSSIFKNNDTCHKLGMSNVAEIYKWLIRDRAAYFMPSISTALHWYSRLADQVRVVATLNAAFVYIWLDYQCKAVKTILG